MMDMITTSGNTSGVRNNVAQGARDSQHSSSSTGKMATTAPANEKAATTIAAK